MQKRVKGLTNAERQQRSRVVDEAVAWYAAQSPKASISAAEKRFGLGNRVLWKRLNPEQARAYARSNNARRRTAKRVWDDAHRATCGRCGGPCGAGTLSSDGRVLRHATGVCAICRSEEAAAVRREMIRLRNEENLSNRAIAARFDVPPLSVANRLSEARRAGALVAKDPYMNGGRRS